MIGPDPLTETNYVWRSELSGLRHGAKTWNPIILILKMFCIAPRGPILKCECCRVAMSPTLRNRQIPISGKSERC